MIRDYCILRIVLIWTNADSLLIPLHNHLNSIHIFLSKSELGTFLKLKFIRLRIINISPMLVLCTTLESRLLSKFTLKTGWKNFLLSLHKIKQLVIILEVLVVTKLRGCVPSTLTKLHSLWLLLNSLIFWIINGSLGGFSQKIILGNLLVKLNL